MSLQEAKQFVAHFIKGEYTPEEYEAFLRWLKGATSDELNAIADEHEALHEYWSLSPAGPTSEWVERLERRLDVVTEENDLEESGARYRELDTPVIDISMTNSRMTNSRMTNSRMTGGGSDGFRRRKAWIAAASVVVLLSSGTFVYIRQKGYKLEQAGQVRHGIEALNITFSNPRGGEQKELELPDGSKVWLNAGSSLKYPSHFTGSERLVQLSGEAFFVVGKNSGNPFRVLIRNAEVEVLGTDFNIMAYEDEPVSRTTLIEGAVKIESGGQDAVLQDGQQAEIPYASPGGAAPIKVVSGIDSKAVVSWKSGYFAFDNDQLRTVMRVLGRSYNVDVQYDPKVPAESYNVKFTGIFNRNIGLAKILEQLEILGIHFKNDGKTVTVSI
jgi:transmembrane sensor